MRGGELALEKQKEGGEAGITMLAASWQRKKTICRKLQALLMCVFSGCVVFCWEGFLADFSPAFFISKATCHGSRELRHRSSVWRDWHAMKLYLTYSSVSCELCSVLLKLSFFAKRQKHNKFLSFLACCLFRERRMLASTWFWQQQGISHFSHCCSRHQVKCVTSFCAFILLLCVFSQRWCAGNCFGLFYVICWKLQEAVCQPVSINTNSQLVKRNVGLSSCGRDTGFKLKERWEIVIVNICYPSFCHSSRKFPLSNITMWSKSDKYNLKPQTWQLLRHAVGNVLKLKKKNHAAVSVKWSMCRDRFVFVTKSCSFLPSFLPLPRFQLIKSLFASLKP